MASSQHLTEPRHETKRSPSQYTASSQQPRGPQRSKRSPMPYKDELEVVKKEFEHCRIEHDRSSASSDTGTLPSLPRARRVARTATQEPPALGPQQECNAFRRFPDLRKDKDSLDKIVIGMLKNDIKPEMCASTIAANLGQLEEYHAIDGEDVEEVFKELCFSPDDITSVEFWEDVMNNSDDAESEDVKYLCDILESLFSLPHKSHGHSRDDPRQQHWKSPAPQRDAVRRVIHPPPTTSCKSHKGKNWLKKFSSVQDSDFALDVIYIGMMFTRQNLDSQAKDIVCLLLANDKGKYTNRHGHVVSIDAAIVKSIYDYLRGNELANDGNPQLRWPEPTSMPKEVKGILYMIRSAAEDAWPAKKRHEHRRYTPRYERSFENNRKCDSDDDDSFVSHHHSDREDDHKKIWRIHQRRRR